MLRVEPLALIGSPYGSPSLARERPDWIIHDRSVQLGGCDRPMRSQFRSTLDMGIIGSQIGVHPAWGDAPIWHDRALLRNLRAPFPIHTGIGFQRGLTVLILIVEDEPIVALNLVMAIEDHGHQVLGAVSSREEVLRLLRLQRPGLALVDIDLHGESAGIGIANSLTHEFGVPAIFLTGHQAQARCNKDSAQGVIAKPFVAERVADCVDAYAEFSAGKHVTFPPALELFE